MNNPQPAPRPDGDQRETAVPAEPEGFARVRELMAAGKFKQAVFSAKEIHKRDNNAASEKLLVEGYLGRIAQFESRGALEDARTLLKLVHDRFPAYRGRLAGLTARAAAAEGKVAELVGPLASPNVAPETREEIESAIRELLIDLPALANCPALPAEHPLRVAARAVWRAFEAVTSGPVEEGVVALPEVSRRSPLAGWKLLVRAIAAFYRDDDDGCRRAIEQVPADSAVRRLAVVLLSAVNRTPPTPGAAAALVSRIQADDKTLPEAFAAFERALGGNDIQRMNRAMRGVMSACTTYRPELVERVRQHIAVRCEMEDFDFDEVVKAAGRPRADAYFWRLLARGMEAHGTGAFAAMFWERFLVHGVREGMFRANGPEAAMIYFRAATMLAHEDESDLKQLRRDFDRDTPLTSMYRGQPPEIAALTPKDSAELIKRVLSPGWLFRQSVELDANSQVFTSWLAWARKVELKDRGIQEIAEVWQRKLPSDVLPALELSGLAESRGSLKLALKHLAAAEAINAMSPEVRKARLRLTLGVTWGHFKDRKPNLVEKDLADLEAMPAMSEGDRPAFLGALRAAYHALRGDEPAAGEAYQALEQRVGPMLAGAFMGSVRKTGRLKDLKVWPGSPPPLLPDPHAVADAVARLSVLRHDLRIELVLPPNYAAIVSDVLRERPNRLSVASLRAVGRLAVEESEERVAYLASSAMLEPAGGTTAAARALLLRAQSLPKWAHQRVWQCLRAASELARQANDPGAIADVAAEIDRHPRVFRPNTARPLGEELLAEILKLEREATTYPKDSGDADRFVVAIDGGPKRGVFEDVDFFGIDDDEDDDEDEDDEDDEDDFDFDEVGGAGIPGLPGGIPTKALPVVNKILDKFGGFASAEEMLQKDPALALELMLALEGLSIDPKTVNEMAKELKNLMPPTGKGKNRKRRK
jgi:hypothetical protein